MKMWQEAGSLDSIPELVEQHKQDTGIMLTLTGVSIKKGERLYFLIDEKGNKMPCFADPKIGLEERNGVNIMGTYHGVFFKVYEIGVPN